MTTTPITVPIPDPDPAETAGAIATTMYRLASEASTLVDPNAVPEIATQLLATLRQMAQVTTDLARLSFHHLSGPEFTPDRDPELFERRTAASRASDQFTAAVNLIYLACQPLAGAQRESARMLARPPQSLATGEPRPSGNHQAADRTDGRPTPRPADPVRSDAQTL